MSDEPIKTLVEGPGGWLWSVDDDDAVYSGVCATEHEARAAMDDTVRSLRTVEHPRARAADQVELKPCPFCSRPAALDLEGEVHLVVCQWCWTRVSSHTEQDAVDRWNTRPVEVIHILGHKAAGDELVQVRAELKQVRADALLLAVLWNGTNRNSRWFHLADDAVGDLSDAERSTLAELWDNLEATNDDLVALLRRALGEQHEA